MTILGIAAIAAVAYALGECHSLPWMTGWACHLYAKARGGTWFTPRLCCAGCGRAVHVMAYSTDMAAAVEDGDGRRCVSCAKGRSR